MKQDHVAIVEIDSQGRLHVMPRKHEFPFVYREALEVSWDGERRSLHSPVPRDWTYTRWLEQIIAAANAQGVHLVLGQDTQWVNVPATVKADLMQAVTHAV